MVFKKEAAPKTRTDFMKWYQDQTEWTEEHSYNDPANASIWEVDMNTLKFTKIRDFEDYKDSEYIDGIVW